jgi:hypothetical protein
MKIDLSNINLPNQPFSALAIQRAVKIGKYQRSKIAAGLDTTVFCCCCGK